jgi:hypothetical protein
VINGPQLLADLIRLLKRLEDDLRQRIADVAELEASLQTEWRAARDADRTAETFESWAEQVITQAGVHWLLSCVFLRFIEDNELVDRPWLGGTPESGRLALARDRHEVYFRDRPLESDRDYLLASFHEAGALPGLHTFFDDAHNPVFRLGISGDAAMALRQFWQQVDPNTGTLAHDFTDAEWNTRFLGDLYQDLSEATRKRYALLQTPEFVEEFILDRTLTPAIREFGFREVRMIDPTCGSGHFLLGGFRRLVDEWLRHEPARNARDIAQRALNAVAGVDLNPFAVAISRFRLLVAALKVSGVHRLTEAPEFKLNVVIGDSLLHGKRFGMTATEGMFEGTAHYAGTGLAHAYASEDLAEVQQILGRQYHAVVGNPPYIVVKDAALNAAYRQRYASCHMKYSLGAPFTERFFDLAIAGNGQPAGFVGLITANSFMKREFGSKLIEQVLPRLDLTHVVDTSGAYIPGHGTPTVILFGRHRLPVGDVVRTVMGIKGEPSTPNDPAQGLAWSAIVGQINRAGSESEFVSVADTRRETLAKHPWSIGGGGAADLKESIEDSASSTLDAAVDIYRFTVAIGGRLVTREVRELGVFGMTNADEVMLAPASAFHRRKVELSHTRPLVVGDAVRDWGLASDQHALFPYACEALVPLAQMPELARWLWPSRTALGNRATFGKSTYFEEGRPWWAWHQIALRRAVGLTITFPLVATHNHFVLDRGGKVFNRHAQVLRLLAGTSENEYLGLIGLLNSSVACFWCQQVMHNKGGPGGGSSKDEKWHDFFEFASTALADFPVAAARPVQLGRQLDSLATTLTATQPAGLLAVAAGDAMLPNRARLDAARASAASLLRQMIAAQEELDWQCYHLYGLLPAGVKAADIECTTPAEVALGERAFEIVLARRMAAGTLATRWFEWLRITPIADIPTRWPEAYRRVVQRRIDLIEHDRSIGLMESMSCKRRWEVPDWPSLEQAALRNWLLDRLEAPQLWPADVDRSPQLSTVNRLADTARSDAAFMQIAELYAGHSGFDVTQVVAELVAGESVPVLPVLRYTDTGLRKRAQWEDTWALQRREDAGEKVGKIPVPPKYQSKDFLRADFWRLRGGLDVAKERWVSYPGCERGADASLPIAWAGWNHLQQATALAAYYLEMKENEGWEATRLQPLLAGLLELLPWLEQWHNEIDPAYGERMGTYYRGFVNEEARALGFTLGELRAWRPTGAGAKRGRKKAST